MVRSRWPCGCGSKACDAGPIDRVAHAIEKCQAMFPCPSLGESCFCKKRVSKLRPPVAPALGEGFYVEPKLVSQGGSKRWSENFCRTLAAGPTRDKCCKISINTLQRKVISLWFPLPVIFLFGFKWKVFEPFLDQLDLSQQWRCQCVNLCVNMCTRVAIWCYRNPHKNLGNAKFVFVAKYEEYTSGTKSYIAIMVMIFIAIMSMKYLNLFK